MAFLDIFALGTIKVSQASSAWEVIGFFFLISYTVFNSFCVLVYEITELKLVLPCKLSGVKFMTEDKASPFLLSWRDNFLLDFSMSYLSLSSTFDI